MGRIAPDRLVLSTVQAHDGNVSAAWRQLKASGWRLSSLSTFRRRVTKLTTTRPTAPEHQPAGGRARRSNAQTDRGTRTRTGDVLVVAIDVGDRDVIRSWVIPKPQRNDSTIASSVREALALRSHLMLDLAEFAAHGTVTS